MKQDGAPERMRSAPEGQRARNKCSEVPSLDLLHHASCSQARKRIRQHNTRVPEYSSAQPRHGNAPACMSIGNCSSCDLIMWGGYTHLCQTLTRKWCHASPPHVSRMVHTSALLGSARRAPCAALRPHYNLGPAEVPQSMMHCAGFACVDSDVVLAKHTSKFTGP